MNINNTFDLIFYTIMIFPFFIGIGIIQSTYWIYSSYTKGIVFSKEELLKDSPILTKYQEFLAGIIGLIFTILFLFVYGIFFDYLDAVKIYLDTT